MMLAGTIWQRELVEFAQRRSALMIKLAFPLVFGVPLVIAAPPVYAAVTLTMLIAIIGALGAGAVLTRERQSGLTLRYRTLAVSRLLPFSYLHESLVGALGGQPNLLAWETLLGGFGFLVGAAGLTGRLGQRVLEAD